MHKVGTVMVWLGLVLSLVGVVFGFGAMFIDADHQAVSLLGLVPIGFMFLLAGVVTVLFSRPHEAGGEGGRREPD